MSTNKMIDKVASVNMNQASPFDTVKEILDALPRLAKAGFTEKQIAYTVMALEECTSMNCDEGLFQIKRVVLAFAGRRLGRKSQLMAEKAFDSLAGMRVDTKFRDRLDEEREEMTY